jgi:hypothetical protein
MESKKIKILAIDDNQDNLIILNALIREAFPNATTLTALNGVNGLALAATEDPDLILLDIVMPGMDGFEVCRKLKADKALIDIPVVFITALKGDKESRIHALECGAEAFLAKPIDETELTAQIRAMAKIKTANTEKRNEKDRLSALVAERTSELEFELAERKRVENALRESEERFRSVAQSANDAIITTNSQGLVIGWNRGAEKMFGYTGSEITNQKLTLIIPQRYEKLHLQGIERVSSEGEHHVIGKTVELYGLHKNGNEFPIELSLAEWKNASGLFFTVIIRDISERKNSEAIIIESEKRYRGLLMNLEAGVVVHAPDTSIIMSNPRASVLLGLNNEQMQGKHAIDQEWKFVYENLSPGLLGKYPVNQVVSTKKPLQNFVLGVAHQAPQPITWLVVNGFPMLDDAGELIEILISFVDITERKQASDALRVSEEKYRDIFNTVQDVFYQTDLNGTILEISPSIIQLLGFEREELLGKEVFDLYPDRNDRNILLNEIISRKSELRDYEIKLKTKSGEIKHVSVTAGLMLDAKGEPMRINGALRDITARKLAEEAFRESDTNYRDLVQKLPDGVYKSTEDGRFVAANPAMAAMLGYDNVEELMAIDIKKQLYFEASDREMAELHEGKAEIGIYRMKKKDGSELWVEGHGWLVFDEDNNTLFHEGIMRDVTGRKRSEDQLRLSEETYRGMLDSITEAVYIQDENGKFLDVNLAAQEMYGYAKEDFIGRTPKFLSAPGKNDLTKLGVFFEKAFNGEPQAFEFWGLRKDGTIFPKDVSNSLCYYFGKKAIIAVARDISERKQSEEELKLSSRAIDQSPVTVMITDKNGNIEYTNPKFTEVTGYTLEEVKGKNPRILQSGEQTKEFYTQLWNTILSGNVWHGEFHNIRKNGESFWESAAISSITDSNGEVAFFLAVKEDITEKRKMIEDLIKAKDRAEESDRLKSAFLANMSHEIRTPMNGILGFAGLLKTPNLTGEEQQEYIEIIESSGARMLNIIKDIVDISKIEAGLMEVDSAESNINEQTDYIYTFFKPEVEGKGMKLSYKNGLTGKAALIKTDREKLYAILINLVKNAVKYSDSGTIEFGYYLTEAQGVAPLLQFYVKDTGIGIPINRQRAIFDRFVQADIADSRAYQGAGLGLSISRAFVEMLGGKLWVESEEGKGSTFYFTIPYLLPAEEKQLVAEKLADTEDKNAVRDLNILIAEDDQNSEILMSMALKKFGREILKVKTGLAAVDCCRINPDLDLIMMDVKMPEMNGYDATRQIRQFNKKVVIIAQTAYALIHEKENAIEAGCNDYISKPISVELLRGLVEKHFAK